MTNDEQEIWRDIWTAELHTDDYRYSPYGTVTAEGDISQPIQWSSEMHDAELGLVYYNYRYYNPVDGRWTRRDPEKDANNLYDYCSNTPINKLDHLGLMAKKTCDELLQKILANPGAYSRRIRMLIEELKENKGCQFPTFECDCTITPIGKFLYQEGKIILNYDRLSNAQALLTTLLHELIHARQHCKITRDKSCEGSICRELASNRDSGYCQNKGLWPNANKYANTKDCIISKAMASAKKKCPAYRPGSKPKDKQAPNSLYRKIESMYTSCSPDYYLPY